MKYHRPLQPIPYSLQGLHSRQISALIVQKSSFQSTRSPWRYMKLGLSILSITIIGWATLITPAYAQDQSQNHHFLIVRYDDYSPRIPMHQIDAGEELETRLFELFRRHRARLVVGVIPFPVMDPEQQELDPLSDNTPPSWLSQPNEWITLLREYVHNGTVDPALHGYEHRRHPPTGYRHGEYRLQPYAWQLASLRQAQQMLSSSLDSRVDVFVPPWNAWDANTARALEELEFTWLSPDLNHAEYSGDQLNIAPQCTADPAQALQWIQKNQDLPGDVALVLVTHPFDFAGEQGETYFKQLEKLLVYVETSNNWQSVGFNDLPMLQASSWAQRFREAVTWDRAQVILHDMFDTAGVTGLIQRQPVFLMPQSFYDSQTWYWQGMIYVVLFFTACVGGAIAWITSRWVRSHNHLLMVAAIVTTGLLVYLILGAVQIVGTGYPVRGIRWQAIAGCAGVMAAFWIIWSSRQATASASTTRQPDQNDQNQPTIDSTRSVQST